MPKQLSSTIMFTVFMVAIVVAANRAEESTEGARAPASAGSSFVVADDIKPALFRHTEKLHGPVTVNIDLIGEAPVNAGDVFVLKGVISSSQRLENVEYHWAVPKSVELISGVPRGDIALIEADRSVELELTFRARDAANAQIHLLATARSHRARFAESAQYNTTRQRAYADSRARLMKSTEASASASPAASDLKVFH